MKKNKISPLSAASYILEKLPDIDMCRLEQFLILAHAHSLAWDDLVMFDYPVTKSKNGYRIPKYWTYIDGKKGFYPLIQGFDNDCLGHERKETLDIMLDSYSGLDLEGLKATLARAEGIKCGTVSNKKLACTFRKILQSDQDTSLKRGQEVLEENIEELHSLISQLGGEVGKGGALGKLAILRALEQLIPYLQDEQVETMESPTWEEISIAMGYSKSYNALRRFSPEIRKRDSQRLKTNAERLKRIEQAFREINNE